MHLMAVLAAAIGMLNIQYFAACGSFCVQSPAASSTARPTILLHVDCYHQQKVFGLLPDYAVPDTFAAGY